MRDLVFGPDFRDRQERLRGVLKALGCNVPLDQYILGFAGVAFTAGGPQWKQNTDVGTRPIVVVPKELAEDEAFEQFIIENAAKILSEDIPSDEIGLIINASSTTGNE